MDKINLLVPINGLGKRFSEDGYLLPKPLIHVLGKPMIFWLFDNLNLSKVDKVIIPYAANLDEYDFQNLLRQRYNVEFVFYPLTYPTKGAAETVLIGLQNLELQVDNNPIMIMDCDTFYIDDVVTKFVNAPIKNTIFYFTDTQTNPLYSYIELSSDSLVKEIAEKEKISDYANCGIYCFESKKLLINYCELLLDKNIKQKNEFYISGVYNLMLQKNIKISAVEVHNFNCLGTPLQLRMFLENKKTNYNLAIKSRDFNQIEIMKNLVIKSGKTDGEKYYYLNVKNYPEVKNYFPKLIDYKDNTLFLEKIQGITLNYLYTNDCLSEVQFLNFLNSLKCLHTIGVKDIDSEFIKKENYNKVLERYKSYDYSCFAESKDTVNKILEFIDKYPHANTCIIHGDPVFTNVLLDTNNNIKFIDMKGKLGNLYTLGGDAIYDLAKVYQSLVGYDHILNGTKPVVNSLLVKIFKEHVLKNYNINFADIIKYTASLYFSLIPLHNNDKCHQYYELARTLIYLDTQNN